MLLYMCIYYIVVSEAPYSKLLYTHCTALHEEYREKMSRPKENKNLDYIHISTNAAESK